MTKAEDQCRDYRREAAGATWDDPFARLERLLLIEENRDIEAEARLVIVLAREAARKVEELMVENAALRSALREKR